jgi:type IX secretion system PorP/SprF family membrane protein
MQKTICNFLSILFLSLISTGFATAQGIHFSQYYNAPLLLNPANAALMRDNDFRVGVNYRSQWANIPAPYKSFSAFGDFQLLRNKAMSSSWLGVGMALFNDKAGDGDLAFTRFEGMMAYHIMISDASILSLGMLGAYSQRSINFSKLTFGLQWDGFKFDPRRINGEREGIARTNFFDVGAGVNYSYSPNELVLVKIGAGVAHINQPKETFYDNTTNSQAVANELGIRPSGTIDVIARTSETFTINPSLYYSTQKGASEFLIGSLGMFSLSQEEDNASQFIVGAFYRVKESVVGVVGIQWTGLKMTASYDYTTKMAPVSKSSGAFEISLLYQGLYGEISGSRQTLNCPRF